MRTEFRRAILPREIRSLMAFDRKVFSSSDLFDAGTWKMFESYWMIVDGVKAGCCAFEAHADFQEDINQGDINPPLKGSLYISTTGILPRFRGMGFGTLLKSWEISCPISRLQSHCDQHAQAQYRDDQAESKVWISDYSHDSRIL